MANTAKQIIGSFEQIGKDVARETVKVPLDIAGKALESIGASSQKGQKGNPQAPGKPDIHVPPEKPVPPREWLAELAGSGKRQKEPTVQERIAREKLEKEQKEQKQTEKAIQMSPIREVSTKPRRGNLMGIKQSSEKGKNARQD